MRIGKAFLAVVCVILAAAVSIGCGKEKEESKTEYICSAPEIVVSSDGFGWASVNGANKYSYKINENGWSDASGGDVISFPKTVGEYVLRVKAVNENGTDGETAEYAFSVGKTAVSCEVVGNGVKFGGENVYYTVNGGEEGLVGAEKTVDFSNAEVGSVYSVECYSKGGFWSAENKTYYLNSDKKTVSLIITQMLAAPSLSVNADGTRLLWTADANATKYDVYVDGVKTVVGSNAGIVLPTTVGKHVITVQAIGEGAWKSSRLIEFRMTTVKETLPAVTYNAESNIVCWDEKYIGKMQKSDDGVIFETLTEAQCACRIGIIFKTLAHYDGVKKEYYPESGTIRIEQRKTPILTFASTDKKVSWNGTDEGVLKNYLVKIGDGEFSEFRENSFSLANLESGEHTLYVKSADCISSTEETSVLYLPSENAEITFTVIEKPELTYSYGRLLWTTDSAASGYEWKKDDGEWTVADDDGFMETTEMAAYEVRPVGSDSVGAYSVASSSGTIFFDPALKSDALGIYDLALFDNAAYERAIGSSDYASGTNTGSAQILLDSADEKEKSILNGANGGVLKLTAGNAKSVFAADWGNSDGMKFNLFRPIKIELNARLVFRVYICSNAARATAAKKDNDGNPLDENEDGIPDTDNIEGWFAFSATGAHVSGAGLFTQSAWRQNANAIPVDCWTEVNIPITAFFLDYIDNEVRKGMTDIRTVYINFIRNAVQGDVFYVDEIRYENVKFPNATTEISFAETNAQKGFSANGGALSVVSDSVFGKNALKYTDNGAQKDSSAVMLTARFDEIELVKGDKITVNVRTNGPKFNIFINKTTYNSETDKDVYIGWVTSAQTQYTLTIENGTTLSALYFVASSGENAETPYEIVLESVKIIKKKTFAGFARSEYYEADESKIALIAATDAAEGAYVGANGVCGANALINVAYGGIDLTAGTIIRIRLQTQSGINVDINKTYHNADSNWAFGGWKDFDITLTADLKLNNLMFTSWSDNTEISDVKIASIQFIAPIGE